MARNNERGRVLFTCSLPLNIAVQIYDFAEELDVGANKIIQELCKYASDRAYIRIKSNNTAAVMFRENDVAE